MFNMPWIVLPGVVKLIVFAIGLVALFSVVRFLRLTFLLYRYRFSAWRGNPAPCVSGTRIAEFVLGGRFAGNPEPETILSICRSAAATRTDGLGQSEVVFTYLFETCSSDIASTKHASALTLLLCIPLLASGAFGTFMYFCGPSQSGTLSCWVRTIDQLLLLLTFGVAVSAVLYFPSIFFAWTLSNREARWKYLRHSVKLRVSVSDGNP